jgi:hypothetical protein
MTVPLEALCLRKRDAMDAVYYEALVRLFGDKEVRRSVAGRNFVQPISLFHPSSLSG